LILQVDLFHQQPFDRPHDLVAIGLGHTLQAQRKHPRNHCPGVQPFVAIRVVRLLISMLRKL